MRTLSIFILATLFLFVTAFERVVFADTWQIPLGARPLSLAADRVVCRDAALANGWSTDGDGHTLRVPTTDENMGKVVVVKVAANQAACASSSLALNIVATGPRPAVDSLILDPDAGRAVARGHHLKGSILKWTSGTRFGNDVCADVDPVASANKPQNYETCGFAISRDVITDPANFTSEIYPAGSHIDSDMTFFDSNGSRLARDSFAVSATEFTVRHLVSPDAAIDLSSGLGRIPLSHPEAVATVSCIDAICNLDGSDLVVRGERGTDETLEVRFQFRPRFVFRGVTAAPDPTPVVMLPLQRCPVTIASATVLSGVDDERVVVRIDGACARSDGDITITTEEGVARIERSEMVGTSLFKVVRIPRIQGDSLSAMVRRRGTILGTAHAPAHAFVWHAKLELTNQDAIDFIPTNRWARVLLPASAHGTAIEVVRVDGVYDTKHDESGDWVRAVDGASGSAPLRLALVDRTLPSPLVPLTIAESSEPVERAIHLASVPLALGAAVREKDPLVEVQCGDGRGSTMLIPPVKTASIPYRARDTCQLIFHRERLSVEDGIQSLHVSVNVSGEGGVSKNDAHVDEQVTLRRNPKPLYMAITGAADPFDRINIRLANSAPSLDQDWQEQRHAPQTQWSVITGTDHARIYGTTAIPTGLFRLADTGHSGILTLSIGAILRLVALSRDGTAFPLGLEGGVMWLGIAGDTDPAVNSRGAVALVFGPGIAVPIANTSRVSQTSINLHGWLEYEVSREVLGQAGQSFGFVFGPSISIGDVGTNF